MFKNIKCPLIEKQLFRYIEYAKLFVKNNNVIIEQKQNNQIIPIASICSIIIGNGVSITHDVFKVCSKYNCIINFVSNKGFNYYASCLCPTHTNYNLLKQVEFFSNQFNKLHVAQKLMNIRFENIDFNNKTFFQMLAIQAVEIKKTYKNFAKMYNVNWKKRNFNFQDSDNVNKYITVFNSFLYSIINTIILTLGYEPRLGFIHNASPLALTYDIADIFKISCSIEIAFKYADIQFDRKFASEVFYETAMKNKIIKKTIDIINYIFS